MFFAAGGMPSSHSALLVSGTLAVGLYHGFDNPLFGLRVAITMIVVHDASGVRRQAGMHAERINLLFEELLKGHMWDENELKEVIGHTPLEVIGGILLGFLCGDHAVVDLAVITKSPSSSMNSEVFLISFQPSQNPTHHILQLRHAQNPQHGEINTSADHHTNGCENPQVQILSKIKPAKYTK